MGQLISAETYDAIMSCMNSTIADLRVDMIESKRWAVLGVEPKNL
jgi:hypothetical protein